MFFEYFPEKIHLELSNDLELKIKTMMKSSKALYQMMKSSKALYHSYGLKPWWGWAPLEYGKIQDIVCFLIIFHEPKLQFCWGFQNNSHWT